MAQPAGSIVKTFLSGNPETAALIAYPRHGFFVWRTPVSRRPSKGWSMRCLGRPPGFDASPCAMFSTGSMAEKRSLDVFLTFFTATRYKKKFSDRRSSFVLLNLDPRCLVA